MPTPVPMPVAVPIVVGPVAMPVAMPMAMPVPTAVRVSRVSLRVRRCIQGREPCGQYAALRICNPPEIRTPGLEDVLTWDNGHEEW